MLDFVGRLSVLLCQIQFHLPWIYFILFFKKSQVTVYRLDQGSSLHHSPLQAIQSCLVHAGFGAAQEPVGSELSLMTYITENVCALMLNASSHLFTIWNGGLSREIWGFLSTAAHPFNNDIFDCRFLMMELEVQTIKNAYREGNQCVDKLANTARNEEYKDCFYL